MTTMSDQRSEIVTLGGGCFWCLEAVYDEVHGVSDVVSGYMGGHVVDPSYRAVCGGTTGHAEVVQLTFDPNEISFRELLEIFFTVHDPTTLNRQGADVGTQYRSAIFYHSDEQKRVAEEVIREFNEMGIWGNRIVTEVTAAPAFFPADESHQGYYRRNPDQGYCRVVIAPKVAKLRQKFMDRLRTA